MNWSAGAEILKRRSRLLEHPVSFWHLECIDHWVILLDCSSHIQNRRAVCRLGNALGDGSSLLLRRLLGRGGASAIAVASFLSSGLWHRLNITEDGQEGHESETNGQHSAEDTSPQEIKKIIKKKRN